MQQRVAPRSFIDFPGPSLDGEASAHATTALRLPYHQTCSDTVMARSERNQTNQGFASWWFQPNGKILVKLDHCPNFRDEKSKKYMSCHHSDFIASKSGPHGKSPFESERID